MAACSSMPKQCELWFLVGCLTALACADASRERPDADPSPPGAGAGPVQPEAHQPAPPEEPSSNASVEHDVPNDAGAPNRPLPDASTSAAEAEPVRDGSALSIQCGDLRMHDTTVEGRADAFRGYG